MGVLLRGEVLAGIEVVEEVDIELAVRTAALAGMAADIDPAAARRCPVVLVGNTRLRRLHVEVGCTPLCTFPPTRCYISCPS